MNEEKSRKDVWNAERILYGYIYDSDDDGFLPNIDEYNNSSYKIGVQRFYAALRAYGRDPEWFYKSNSIYPWSSNSTNVCRCLLSLTRSDEKMKEFRELVKKHLSRTPRSKFIAQVVDSPDYLKSDMDVYLVFSKLMDYRRRLNAIDDVWSGMMECSRTIGSIFEVTRDMAKTYLWPMCQILDRMLILLMGDDYDNTFTTEELRQFGYPDVTDDELHRISMEEEW